MLLYKYDYKNNIFVFDLKDEFLSQSSQKTKILNILNIEEFEYFDDFEYNQENNYRLKNNIVEIFDDLIINEFKVYLFNRIYNYFISNRYNIQHNLIISESLKKEIRFLLTFPDYIENEELCFLDILNSGDEEKISLLEELLEIDRYNIDFIKKINKKWLEYERNIFNTNSLNMFILNLIELMIYLQFDLKSLDINKQFHLKES